MFAASAQLHPLELSHQTAFTQTEWVELQNIARVVSWLELQTLLRLNSRSNIWSELHSNGPGKRFLGTSSPRS